MNWKGFSLLGLFCIVAAAYLVWHGATSVHSDPSFYENRHGRPPNNNSSGESDSNNDEKSTPPAEVNRKDKNERTPANAILTEEDFLKHYPGKWLFKRLEKGKLNYITGGNIPARGRSPQSVREFVNEISPLLEVSAKEITNPKEINRTDLTRVYHSQQVTDGFVVYQSVLSIHVRGSDDSIFMVNNQLKDVSGYNQDLRYTQKQAETYIQSRYAGEYEKIIFRQGPVIFKSNSGNPELAWVFVMTYKQPKLQQVELVIGAHSGEEIYRQNVNIQ